MTERNALFLFLIFFGSFKFSEAQNPDVLQSRILTAVRRSSLVASRIQPFKLEASITVYDGAGKNPESGTIDISRRADNFRVAITFPTASGIVLKTAAGSFATAQGTFPYFAAKITRRLQGPAPFYGFGSSVAKTPEELAKGTPLECATLADTSHAIVTGPREPIHELCLESANDDIRVVVDDHEEYVRDEIVSFGEQRVAKRLHLVVGGFNVAEISVQSLRELAPSEGDFVPSPDMKPEESQPAHRPGNVMAGRITYHESPKYPGVARAAHIQGVVILRAIIGKDGHIRDLSVISSPDKSLSEASLKAVAKWTYEPYMLEGQATEIDTTITVNFAMGKP